MTTAKPSTKTTIITPHFKHAFWVVVVLTVVTFGVTVWIALGVSIQTDGTKQVMEQASTLSKLGFGAIIGLIGGKTPSS